MRKYTVKLNSNQLQALSVATANISFSLREQGETLLSLLMGEVNFMALDKYIRVQEKGKLKLSPSQSWACMRCFNDADFNDAYLENTIRDVIEQLDKQYKNARNIDN